MEKSIETIKLFSTSKDGVENFIANTINEVKAGNVNPLELSVYLKAIELSLEGIRDGIQEEMLREHSKYNEKSIDFMGFKIEQAEVGVRYDFSKCDDDKLIDLEIDANNLDYKIKMRKEYLKSIQGHEVIIDDNGAVTIIKPPIKTSKTSLKFTIKK